MGTELFHADGRTDMTKVIVALRNFAKAPKNKNDMSDTYLSAVRGKSEPLELLH